MSAVTEQLKLLKHIRESPKTAKNLSDLMQVHPQTVRKHVRELTKMHAVKQIGYRKGSIRFTAAQNYRRNMPYVKRWHKELNHYVFNSLDIFLQAIGQPSATSESGQFFANGASKLLMLGLKYHTIKQDNHDQEGVKKATKALLRELRLLRTEYEGHLKALRDLTDLYEQVIEHEDFWNLEALAKHFDPQVDYEGELIPPVGTQEVIEAYQKAYPLG